MTTKGEIFKKIQTSDGLLCTKERAFYNDVCTKTLLLSVLIAYILISVFVGVSNLLDFIIGLIIIEIMEIVVCLVILLQPIIIIDSINKKAIVGTNRFLFLTSKNFRKRYRIAKLLCEGKGYFNMEEEVDQTIVEELKELKKKKEE